MSVGDTKQKLRSELCINVGQNKELCESCIYGKLYRRSFGTRQKTSSPGELTSADLVGPFKESFNKNKFLVLFKDNYTKYCSGFLIKYKSEVTDKLREVLQLAKTQGYFIQ